MKILALDTATETGGIALLEDEGLWAQAQIRVTRTHTRQIWETIGFLLKQVEWGLEDIDLWAVTVGPGSFTGLRIGLATIKGLAFATQKPVVGISTLEALAFSFPFTPFLICPVIDARKKEVFCAYFRSDPEGNMVRVSESRNCKPQLLVDEIKEKVLLVGNGARLYRDLFESGLGPLACFPEPYMDLIPPVAVGFLARTRFLQTRNSSLEEIRPLYLRPSDAELKKA